MRVMLWPLVFAVLPAAAEETLVLRESSIKAMEGLPAVTFMVPWQASESISFIAMPDDSVLDDYLLLLDSSLLPSASNNAVAAHDTNKKER